MMSSADEASEITYRVILVDDRQLKILAVADGTDWRLMRVKVPRRSRRIPELLAQVEATWNIRSFVVADVGSDLVDHPCAVARVISARNGQSLTAVDIEDIAHDEINCSERAALEDILLSRHEARFCRLDWMEEALAWVGECTGKSIDPRTEVLQIAAGVDFALLQIVMSNGEVLWLKASGAQNGRECCITSSLSMACPQHVPNVIGVRSDWNAWLMSSSPFERTFESMTPSGQAKVLPQSAKALAVLQAKTSCITSDLLKLGAVDQQVSVLKRNAAILFEKVREAMHLQTSTTGVRITDRRLDELQSYFCNACSRVAQSGVGPTVLHGDLNPGNVILERSHCRFIDWNEAYVGFPLVSLQHLILLSPAKNAYSRATLSRRMIHAYMEANIGNESMCRLISLMPVLAAGSAMYGRGDWMNSNLASEPSRARYLRIVIRHMDQAAQNPEFLKEIAA